MNAEPVLEKILSDARAEADKIKKEAEAKLTQERVETDKRLEEYRKQTDALAKKAGADAKSQVLSAVRMELAKENLAEKAKMLDEVFSKAEQQLKTMPDEQYRSLMTKLMADSAQTGDEEVIIDTNEKRIDQSLINEVNSRRKSNLKLAGQRENIAGGFILKKGKIKNNCSLNVLLSRARGELEIELAKQLFAG
jgi:V/A-type H+-transporting ATPase subunit E